jgi:hypothetical protein
MSASTVGSAITNSPPSLGTTPQTKPPGALQTVKASTHFHNRALVQRVGNAAGATAAASAEQDKSTDADSKVRESAASGIQSRIKALKVGIPHTSTRICRPAPLEVSENSPSIVRVVVFLPLITCHSAP